MTTTLRAWSRSAAVRLDALALATLSLGAAAIHFAVIADHFAEYLLFGAFFAGIGWFQALWALAYTIRPARTLAALGISVNALTVAIWIWAHVVGLPFGPDPGHLEPTTITDVAATLFEILLVVGLFSMGRQANTGADMDSLDPRRVLATLGLIAAVAIGTTIALAQQPM